MIKRTLFTTTLSNIKTKCKKNHDQVATKTLYLPLPIKHHSLANYTQVPEPTPRHSFSSNYSTSCSYRVNFYKQPISQPHMTSPIPHPTQSKKTPGQSSHSFHTCKSPTVCLRRTSSHGHFMYSCS